MRSIPLSTLKRWAPFYALFIIIAFSGFILLRNGWTHLNLTIQNIDSMLHTTVQQRKAELYSSYGYEYFTYIDNQIPEKLFTPLLRYFDWSRNLTVVLPGEGSYNPNLMLAMDVEDDVFNTNLISPAEMDSADNNRQIWSFSTLYDFDTLQEFRLIPKVCAFSATHITINIYSMIDSKEPYNSTSTTINCRPEEEQIIKLSEEIHRFSMGRGASKFKVEIITDHNITWGKVGAYGIRINISDYTLINKLGKNHTFILKEFLDKITSEDDSNWLEFIKSIKNV